MSGADFILAINLCVAGLLASAFMTIAVYDIRRVSARWLAFSYLIGMSYLILEFSIPAFQDARPAVTVAFAVFLGATIAFNVGLARTYDVRPPSPSMLAFLLATSFVVYCVQDMPRQSFVRMMAYQMPYAVMQIVGMAVVGSSKRRRQWPDRALMGLLAASALQFTAKPFIASALGGWGVDPQRYLQSDYALVSQSLGTVFALAIALLMLVILVRDVMAEATSKSETDALSGLLNRGGFERRAEAALRDAVRHGVPVSLVIADLDHFKAINDNFGHASGDSVIEAFAGFLREAAADRHVAGRIGGEEFAILLWGTNHVAGRLFAEGARNAFGVLPIEKLPREHRCSASFGVAEIHPGEGFADLMRRADEALYAAKKDGRDRVRIWQSPIAVVQREIPPVARSLTGRG